MKKAIFLCCAALLAFVACEEPTNKIDHLKTFAKAYGYVKYFHPSDEAADLDWNAFAAYGAQQIEQCNNKKEVVKTLNELFKPIAPGVVFSTQKRPYDFDPIRPERVMDYQTTYWQHNGVSQNMNHQNSVYRSIRVNTVMQIDKAAPFGNLTMVIDPSPYQGKTIKYTGWSKLKAGSEGTGHLWMRVDKPHQQVGFFENMNANPITSQEWQPYEIIGQVDANASNLLIGAFMKGKGTLYLDEVHVYYKENEEWIEIPIQNGNFEARQIGKKDEESNWFGRSTGYAYSLSKEEQKTGDQCAVIAYEGLLETTKGNPLFNAKPEFEELIEKEIGKGIYCQIPLNLYCNTEGTYPESETANALKIQLENLDKSLTHVAVRWGNVINAYNVFQHFYPYFEESGTNWEQEFTLALKRSISDQTPEEHLVTLEKLTAALKDGHSGVWSGKEDKYTPPIIWEWIEDQLVITAVEDPQLALSVGDVVTLINEESPKTYFEKVTARISAGTQGWLDYRAQALSLLGKEGSELIIEVNGQRLTLTRNQVYDHAKNTIPIQTHSYQLMDNGLVYLNLDKVEMDTINQLMPKLEKANGIICDLRGYPNNNHDLIAHLLKMDDTSTMWMRIPQIIYPDQENITGYENTGWGIKAQKPYLGDKKVVFITDGRAISYAESYMGFIEGYDLATIVGQPTAGTNGNINPFQVLGGIMLNWTGMKVFKHNGTQHHGIGILPDVPVEKTIAGVKAGKDEFLEKAIEEALKL